MWGPWIKVNWKWSNRRWQQWVNIDILGICELKWTGMGKFNSDDYYIYYCGQESLRRNIAIIVNKRVWNAVLACNPKNDRMISIRFQSNPFNITVIQLYAPTMDVEHVGNLYPYGYSSRCKYICHKHQKVKQQHRIKACFKITVKVMSKDK